MNRERAELLEEALWQNMEVTKRKREWKERAIAERKNKKSKKEVSGPSMRCDAPNMPAPDDTNPASTSSRVVSPSDHSMEVEDEEHAIVPPGDKGDRADGDQLKKKRK